MMEQPKKRCRRSSSSRAGRPIRGTWTVAAPTAASAAPSSSCSTKRCATFVVKSFFFLRCHLWPSSLTAKPLIPAILAGGASSAVAADAALPARLQPDGHPVARPRPRPLDLPPLDAAPTAGPGRPDVVALVRPPALRSQGSLDFLELHFHQEITFVGQSEVPFL